jgi:GT2 family glycosyltransferase/protoporphyrinogen oxidase
VKVGILGGGVAGLSCAWLLKQRGIESTVFENQDYFGGLARSFTWRGFTVDFAVHRLFTQDENVLRQLLALVPMGRHVRRSRIYLADKWVGDPVNIIEVLLRYFPVTTTRVIWSYLTRPRHENPSSFDEYVESRYGYELNRFFFRPYTEKLFGIPGSEIAVDWAQRKVRISSPLDILRESSKKHFSYFYYPIRGGYGAIVNRLYDEVRDQVKLSCPVVALEREGNKITDVVFKQDGQLRSAGFDEVISTLPLTLTGRMLGYEFPLNYRKVDAVYLLVDQPYVSANHWIYYMDRDVSINRLTEFKNLSAVDCPADKTVLCAEVTDDYDDVETKVVADVVRSGLVARDKIRDTMSRRERFGYPVYDQRYLETVAYAKKALGEVHNLHLVGRSAEFEHKEVDDNWASAAQLVQRLIKREPVVVAAEERIDVMQEDERIPLVYGVILTFNHVEDTIECLESLQKLEAPGMDFRVLVVDNGSTDNTPDIVRERYPEVQVIETGRNLGVPWGYNVGFSHALRVGADYILMLNNDTVVAPDMLVHLAGAGEVDPVAGILVPKVLYYDEPDRIWAAGGHYRAFPPAITILGQDKRDDQYTEPLFLEYALSCGLLIHRRAFEKAGLFDPGYFFLFDDWDFSQRVRTHGLHIQLVPEARMWHKVSRSTSQHRELFWKVWGESSARYYRRHGRPAWVSLPVHVGYLMAREFVKGNGRMLKFFWAGVRAGLAKPLGPIPGADSDPLPSTQLETPKAQ